MADKGRTLWMALIYVQVVLGHMNLWQFTNIRRTVAAFTVFYNMCTLLLKAVIVILLNLPGGRDEGFQCDLHRFIISVFDGMVAAYLLVMFYHCHSGRGFSSLRHQMDDYRDSSVGLLQDNHPSSTKRVIYNVLSALVATMALLAIGSSSTYVVLDYDDSMITAIASQWFPSLPGRISMISFYLFLCEMLIFVYSAWAYILLMICTIDWLCHEYQVIQRYVSVSNQPHV